MSTGHAKITQPGEQAVAIELREQAVMLQPIGQAKNIETRKKARKVKLRGQDGPYVSKGKTENIELQERAVVLKSSRRTVVIEPREQAVMIEPIEQAGNIQSTEETAAIESSGRAVAIAPREQSVRIKPIGQAGNIQSTEETAAIVSSGQAVAIAPREQPGIAKSKGKSRNIRGSKQSGSGKYIKPGETSKSKEQTDRIGSLLEQAISRESKSLRDVNLSNFVDIQQLFNIGYSNPELLPLIKRISVVGEVIGNFNPQVQSELVAMIKVADRTIKEFVSVKNRAYNSDAAEDTIYRLLPKLSEKFSRVVLKHGRFILDPAMRNLVEWKAISAKLSRKRMPKKHGVDLFDLSKRFQMKDLIKIGRDHPEFRTNIKTILGVNAAMKHLNHDGQVEVYRILRRIEKIIKDLVQEKTNPDGCHDIFLTPETLSSSLDYCIEKILMHLKSTSKIPIECSQCEMDRSYVRNVHIEPDLGTLKRPRPSSVPQKKRQFVFEYANWGITQDCIRNIESLIHHLTAKKGALKQAWLFENCIDWFEIACLFADYKAKTCLNMAVIKCLKLQMLETMAQVDEVMGDARDFCARMRVVKFIGNETLSDVIALSGQIEMLASEVEYYMIMIDQHIRDLLRYRKKYTTLTTRVRANRLYFLTRTQWRAFDFPFF